MYILNAELCNADCSTGSFVGDSDSFNKLGCGCSPVSTVSDTAAEE